MVKSEELVLDRLFILAILELLMWNTIFFYALFYLCNLAFFAGCVGLFLKRFQAGDGLCNDNIWFDKPADYFIKILLYKWNEGLST